MTLQLNNYWAFGALIYAVILTVLSLAPRQDPPPIPEPKEQSNGLLPKEGDDFKMVNNLVVYHLEQGHRRPYKTSASYLLRSDNPPYGTPYEEGGILCVDSFVLLLYPLGTDMPRLKDTTSRLLTSPPSGPPWWHTYTRHDKLGHLCVYGGLALLLTLSFRQHQKGLWGKRFGVVMILGTALGWALEAAQAVMNTGRDAEWADLLMNSLGLVGGAWLAEWWIKRQYKKKA